jgi:uncharacterized membrane protein
MTHPVEILARVQREVTERMDAAYRAWLDKVTTLSLAALTLLVSLQSTYVPQNPRGLWLLCAVWGLLAASVLAGLLALFGEARAHRLYLVRLRDTLQPALLGTGATPPLPGHDSLLSLIQKVPYTRPRFYLGSAAVAAVSLGLAVLGLAVFAGWNL